eukprot:GHVH01004953.1.p2 GENE.GHVH01004953.1~~GHVH01004953.1.p2  ORF type:complete len:120 (+),score=19.69 GHVH01004953.1:578-937(+)
MLLLFGVVTIAIACGVHYKVRHLLAKLRIYVMSVPNPMGTKETFTMTRNGKEFKLVAEVPDFKDSYNLSLHCCPKLPEDLELLELAIKKEEMTYESLFVSMKNEENRAYQIKGCPQLSV